MTSVTPRPLPARLQKGEKPRLLDVRTSTELAEIHLPKVQLIPLALAV